MNRYSFSLFTFTIVVAAVSWWLSEISAPKQTLTTSTDNTPDFYAEQLTVTQYDKLGVPQYKLHAPQMRQFEHSHTTELERPRMWQFSQDTPPWVVNGEQARYEGNEEIIFMPGQVVMEREKGTASPPYHIVTRDLTLNTNTAYAETDQAIRIDSEAHWITAIGMQGWLQEPVRIKLMNRVRGYYENL